jgi:hypothetical protein
MMQVMRTTVTLDPDAEALVKRLMDERGLTFKQAVNHAIREGLAGSTRTPFSTPTFRMGFDPAVPWDKALRLAAELEDEELVRRLAERR